MLLDLSILQIGNFNQGLVTGLPDSESPILLTDSLALGQNIRRAFRTHSASNPVGVEVQSDKYAAVVPGGRFGSIQASGYLVEGFAHSARIVSPPKSVISLIANNSKLFVSKDAINNPNLDFLLNSLHEAISTLEEERLERSSLGSIECGDLTIYPTMHENHLSSYVIQTINEPKIVTRRSIGIIDIGTGKHSTAA